MLVQFIHLIVASFWFFSLFKPYHIHLLFNNSIPNVVLLGDSSQTSPKSQFLWNSVLLPFMLSDTMFLLHM